MDWEVLHIGGQGSSAPSFRRLSLEECGNE